MYLPIGQVIDPLLGHMVRQPFQLRKERRLVLTEQRVVVPQWFLPERADVNTDHLGRLEDLGREGGREDMNTEFHVAPLRDSGPPSLPPSLPPSPCPSPTSGRHTRESRLSGPKRRTC